MSELHREGQTSLGENFDETASGYPETLQRSAGAEEAQKAEQDTGAKGSQDAGESIGEKEAQGYGQDAAAEAGQTTGQNIDAPGAENQPGAGIIFVHVCGQVNSPGVYELPAGSRFYEAVEAAGGFTEDACRDYLNMAASLADGSRLEIPSAEAVAEKKESEDGSKNAGGEDEKEQYSYYTVQEDNAAPEQAGGGTGGASEGLVNINTADMAGLCALPGVGEGRAKAIIEYREKQGGFRKKEDIMEVSGIGEKMYARMEPYLTVE